MLVDMRETLLKHYSLLREIDSLVLTRIDLSINIISITIHSIEVSKFWCRQLVLRFNIRRTIDLHIKLNLAILLRTIKLINRDSISILSLSIQVDYKSIRNQTEAWNYLKDFRLSSSLQID